LRRLNPLRRSFRSQWACPDPANPGETINYYTSDPGKGLITGQCVDVNRGKGPVLRGLAARAPYFHNRAAANLHELVKFYNQRSDEPDRAREAAADRISQLAVAGH
jgi:cytochrome c peroxidase